MWTEKASRTEKVFTGALASGSSIEKKRRHSVRANRGDTRAVLGPSPRLD
jgi:hypothetical protein